MRDKYWFLWESKRIENSKIRVLLFAAVATPADQIRSVSTKIGIYISDT